LSEGSKVDSDMRMGVDCFSHEIIGMNMFIGHADLSYSTLPDN